MLKEMKVAELREVAEAFGIEDPKSKTKAVLLVELAEEGVTDEVYQQFTDAESVEVIAPAETPPPATRRGEEDVLVYMNRANPTFEIRGHRFTKEHPYVAMSQSDAQGVFDYDPRGFRLATPNEVKEYYS